MKLMGFIYFNFPIRYSPGNPCQGGLLDAEVLKALSKTTALHAI
jgi:hypothetical protein